MKIKECYVSHNGISCFTNINSMHNIKNIDINNFKFKNNILLYLGLRLCEFIINDFMSNKHIFFNFKNSTINDNVLESFIYN